MIGRTVDQGAGMAGYFSRETIYRISELHQETEPPSTT